MAAGASKHGHPSPPSPHERIAQTFWQHNRFAYAEATDLRRWFSKGQTDIRDDIQVTKEVLAFITEAGAKSVLMTDRIIGCPHEEGIDYEGVTCPACPFWAGRDR